MFDHAMGCRVVAKGRTCSKQWKHFTVVQQSILEALGLIKHMKFRGGNQGLACILVGGCSIYKAKAYIISLVVWDKSM